MADRVGFDLPCGAGRLGLQGAPGALPRALAFESQRGIFQKGKTIREDGLSFLAKDCCLAKRQESLIRT